MGKPIHVLRGGVLLLAGALVAAMVAVLPAFTGSALAADAGAASPSGTAGLASADGGLLAQSVSVQAVKDGWSADRNYYYRDGKKVTGLQKIDGKRYFFNDKGKLKRKDFSSRGAGYFVNEDGSIMGLLMYGQYYYDTLKPMTEADAYDFATFLWARYIVQDLSSSGDQPWDKLRKSFNYVVSKGYAIHRTFNPYQENWMAVFARDHFNNDGGDCHSDGAAFAYLAAAIGYEAYVCIDSWAVASPGSHCWTMIDGAVYDPLFYEAKSTMYYGATSGTYEVNPTASFRVPTYSPKHADPNAKVPSELLQSGYVGLKKLNGNYYFFKKGEPVKSAWKTVAGKRYYFTKDGSAATGPAKIKGKRYVFNTKGELQNSKKKGKRVVKVAGAYYRVNEKGQAAKGWSANGKKYFLTNGRMVVGKQVVNGKFFIASKKGVYNKSQTHAARVASKKNAPAAKLYNLLGKPQQVVYSANCEGLGDDGLWEYKNFIVTTIKPHGAHTAKYDAKLLKKGKKLPEKYEYICSIEAR